MIDVVAIGGHALSAPGGAPVEGAEVRVDAAAGAIARHLSDDGLLISHGNGPQAGWLVAQAEAALGRAVGLDAITAQTEGLTGYQIELALGNALPGREIATLLTQVEVDPADPALRRPSKPIGRVYDDEEADCLRMRGLAVAWDADRSGFRRVVASPAPLRILEERAIARLLGGGAIVVCAGGGGIAVCRGPNGKLHGVDAILDKDHTSSLLAVRLGAQRLFLLTDVPGVYPQWPRTDSILRSAAPGELAAREWAAGSMAPKVAAAGRFSEEAGGTAWIGRVEDLAGMLDGSAGTRIHADAAWVEAPTCPVS